MNPDLIKQYQDFLKTKNYEGCLNFISEHQSTENLCDLPDPENEMTLFMHTVFTGQLFLVKPMLSTAADKKASVNFTIHKNDYTPLMMSTLTNKIEVVKYLLENGADTSLRSSINKTAAELAAFTGHSEIAALLSNFYQTDVKMSKTMTKLVAETNLAPSNIALRYMTQLDDPVNKEQLMDIYQKEAWPLSGKCAYLYHIVEEIEQADDLGKYIKLQSISANLQGTKPFQHAAIIAALEKIATRDPQFNAELNQLLTTASKLDPNSATTFALRLIEDIFCSIKVRKQSKRCDVCFEPDSKKQCCGCQLVRYCSLECHKMGWFDHKKWCKKLVKDEQQRHADRAAGKSPEIDMQSLKSALK